MTLFSLVAVPFVLVYVDVGFTVVALFGIWVSRSGDSGGTDSPGWDFEEGQPSVRAKRVACWPFRTTPGGHLGLEGRE